MARRRECANCNTEPWCPGCMTRLTACGSCGEPAPSQECEDCELERDRARIGTPEYQGHAWFWGHAYRHALRDATPARRRSVHRALLRDRLELDGESADHERVIKGITERAPRGRKAI